MVTEKEKEKGKAERESRSVSDGEDKWKSAWTNLSGERPRQKLTTGKFRTRKELINEVLTLRTKGLTYSSIGKKCLVSAYVVRKILIKGSADDPPRRIESGSCNTSDKVPEGNS